LNSLLILARLLVENKEGSPAGWTRF